MVVPAFPNGTYFFYALVTRSNILQNLNMAAMGGMNEDSDYIRVPMKEYDMVVKAYEKKVNQIESKMHNLSSIEITLEPLTDVIRINSTIEQVFLSLTIEAYMAEKK